MNRYAMLIVATIILLLGSNSAITAFQSQDQSIEPVISQTRSTRPAVTIPSIQSAKGIANFGTTNRRNSWKNPMQDAVEKLRDAEDGDDREEAEMALRELLEEQYDLFLEANEEQIKQLQERLDNLKDQLKRRRQAKNKMVDLEMQSVIYESEGLIWPKQNSRGGGLFYRNLDSGQNFMAPPESPFAPSAPAKVRFPSRSRNRNSQNSAR